MTLIRRLNVDAMSWRCIDVEPTLYKRHVPAGIKYWIIFIRWMGFSILWVCFICYIIGHFFHNPVLLDGLLGIFMKAVCHRNTCKMFLDWLSTQLGQIMHCLGTRQYLGLQDYILYRPDRLVSVIRHAILVVNCVFNVWYQQTIVVQVGFIKLFHSAVADSRNSIWSDLK